MTYAALGAVMFVVCAGLVAAMAAVTRRLRLRERARSAAAREWSTETTRLVGQLRGATFERVTFENDRPQLEFAGERDAVVTMPHWFAVIVGSRVHRFGDPGFREAIRSLQGDTVRSARTTPEREIVIELSGGSFMIEPSAARR